MRERLTHSSSHERLSAARELARVATLNDIPLIKMLLAKETVSFVKRSLGQTLKRLEEGRAEVVPVIEETDTEEEVGKQAYWKAVEWATGTILHEILPRLGSIRAEAERVTPRYGESRLKTKIDDLAYLMDGIEELRRATMTSALTEVVLGDFVKNCAGAIEVPSEVRILFFGASDVSAIADPNLLRMAFCNGLRNAIEATASQPEGGVVTVSWGETEVDYWISVIDEGPGLAGSAEAAFKIGRTSKRGHRGLGLSIADMAMTTLDGKTSLKPNTPHGVVFELRWFK